MKALSIKQPWAYLIASGAKNIENRTWKTNFRGRIYIHASGKPVGDNIIRVLNEHNNLLDSITHNQYMTALQYDGITSAIIGEVDIIDCVQNHPSVWAEHKAIKIKEVDGKKIELEVPVWNWVLDNAVRYKQPILNIKGGLSFWDYDLLTTIYKSI